MDARALLKIAGDAAQLLDRMGLTAVARLREGVVTLEVWQSHRSLRRVVDDVAMPARELAESCAAELSQRPRPRTGPLH